MFIMEDEPTFPSKVEGKMPDGSDFSFTATFVALGSDAQAEYDFSTDAGTKEFSRRVLKGFGDILDANEVAVPFNETTRDWMVDKPWVRSAMVVAYFRDVYGALLGN